jgi:DNA-binding transcriptional MocR family regulator
MSMTMPPEFAAPTTEPCALIADFMRSVPPIPAGLGASVMAAVSDIDRDRGLGLVVRAARSGGSAPDREAGVEWLAPRLGSKVQADRLIVTNGTQAGVLILLEALVGQGGLLLAETLSWGSLAGIAARAHVRVEGLPIDAEGIVPDALEAACRSGRPKALYCNPTDHNPTTATMSVARRQAIAGIAQRYGLPIIEDDALGLMHPQAPPPLAAMVPDQVWYVMGLAKCLAHGLRLAYVVGPSAAETERVFGPASRLSFWAPSPLSAAIATCWIGDGTAASLSAAIRAENDSRFAIARSYLAGLDLAGAAGSMHVWLRLPETVDRHRLAAILAGQGVLVRPAELFALAGGEVPNAIRLSLSSPIERIEVERGLAVIASVLGQPRSL